MAAPTLRAALLFEVKARVLRCRRAVRDARGGPRRFTQIPPRPDDVVLAESISRLWTSREDAAVAERALNAGKVQNLRLAARRIDGALVPAGATFSFWKHVGRATRRRGYVSGRELREGCLVPSVGGGLCQLSNALYDAALRAGFEIVERHAHTAVVPGSLAEAGRDATVFWNYVDLRFRPACEARIEVTLTADSLIVRLWGAWSRTSAVVEHSTSAVPRAVPSGDCASCAVEQCFRHVGIRRHAVAERTAFLLDAHWPEYDAYVGSIARRDDVVFVPLDGRRRGTRNYRWQTAGVDDVRESPLLVMLRSYQSRRLAQHGAARQRMLLAWARRMAENVAARLPPEATHLVVMQHLLPALWEGRHLGGRTYDVLMTGFPMRALHAALDRAYGLHPQSPTLADFRAAPELVEAEESALAGARTIVTPHARIAAMFGSRGLRLPWSAPERDAGANTTDPQRDTVLFPASTLGRSGAYELRDAARSRGLRVLLTGPDLEGAGFWDGISVERMPFDEALASGPAAVVLPAHVEHQPRRLLAAAARGIPVIATDACGIVAAAGVHLVPSGDAEALADAIERVSNGVSALRA